MKINNTNITKSAARRMRSAYLEKQREVDRDRRKYQQVMETIKQGEEDTIARMLNTAASMCLNSPSGSVTASAIAQKFPDMSREEIVGQLVVAGGEHYNGSGRTHGAKHKVTRDAIANKSVKIDWTTITRQFIELDANGKPVEGGQVIELTTRQNRYKVKAAK